MQTATVERGCLTATALAAPLGVSEKTVKRGLRTSQSDLGLPLRWDPTEHTWRVDPRPATAKIEDLARIPFQARALAFDGKNFWTNRREQNQIVCFARPD